MDNGFELVVALRRGAIEFLKRASQFFNIYIFSYLGRDLLFDIINKILDPDGVLIIRKDFKIHRERSRVWTYCYPYLKNPNDLLYTTKPQSISEYELRNFMIVDRSEHQWPQEYSDRIICLKTFAPLSSNVIGDNSFDEFPISISYEISKNRIDHKLLNFKQMFVASDIEKLLKDQTFKMLGDDLEKLFVTSI